MTVREVIRLLQDDGWYVVRIRGSHRQLRHRSKPGTVTVAGNLGTDIPFGTLRQIRRQAGLENRR